MSYSEIVAFLLYRLTADKPAPPQRRWILALCYQKRSFGSVKSPDPIGIAAHP
jgi:hypothetical protein